MIFKRSIKIIIVILTSLALFWVILVSAYQKVYAGKIYSHVYLDGVKLSGKSASDAEDFIKKRTIEKLDTKIVISANNANFEASLKDTGVIIDSQKITSDCYSYGRTGNILNKMITVSKLPFQKIQIKMITDFDQTSYDSFISKIKQNFESPAIDASVTIENEKTKGVPEKAGLSINVDNFKNDVQSLLTRNTNSIILETKIIDPKIKIADIEPTILAADKMLAKTVTLNYEKKTIAVPKPMLASWITFEKQDKTYQPKFDQDKVKDFVRSVASQNDATTEDKRIDAVTNQVIQEGKVGKLMDQSKTATDLWNQLNQDKDQISITIPVQTISFNTTGRFPGKYIDVAYDQNRYDYGSVSKLYMVDNLTVIGTHYAGMGTPGTEDETPTGTFKIISKQEMRHSSIYDMDMPYWQNFSGNFGIHQAITGLASGGCITMYQEDAKTLYDWTVIGTPIYIHKAN